MHRLTLLLVGLGLLAWPASAQTNQTVGTGFWTKGPGLDTCIPGSSPLKDAASGNRIEILNPGETAYFVVSGDADGENNVNADCDDGDRDSLLLDVSLCPTVTLQFIKLVGDSNVGEGILMNADKVITEDGVHASTVSDPICADVDGDGVVDCDVMTGDTGIDQDGDASAVNDSLFWGFGPLAKHYVWWDTTVSPGTSKVSRVAVACAAPQVEN